jgi:hypothetical protein
MRILTSFLVVFVTLTSFQAIYSDLKAVNAATTNTPPIEEPTHRGGRR